MGAPYIYDISHLRVKVWKIIKLVNCFCVISFLKTLGENKNGKFEKEIMVPNVPVCLVRLICILFSATVLSIISTTTVSVLNFSRSNLKVPHCHYVCNL